MRLYWSKVLRNTRWYAGIKGHKDGLPSFTFYLMVDGGRRLKMTTYEATTVDDLYQQLKAAGHQIWGYKDYLDYAWPTNALELMMVREILEARGDTIEGINE